MPGQARAAYVPHCNAATCVPTGPGGADACSGPVGREQERAAIGLGWRAETAREGGGGGDSEIIY
jgi:hypothetical protein